MKRVLAFLVALILLTAGVALADSLTVPVWTLNGDVLVAMEVFHSPLNYSIAYDKALFEVKDNTISAIDGSLAYISVQSMTDMTLNDLREGLVIQAKTDDVIQDVSALGGYGMTELEVPVVLYTTDLDGDVVVSSYYLAQRKQDVLLVECCYSLDAADDLLTRLEPMLKTFCVSAKDLPATTAANTGKTETEMVYCGICGKWYRAGNEFRNHICKPQATAKPNQPEMVYCEICGNWYEAGNIFRNHICVPKATAKPSQPEMVYCEICGNWYEAGNIFRNHICVPMATPEPEMVYCEICGNWYEAGNVFRNHICVPQGGYEEPQASQPEMVYCDVCGNWYEAGNVFRNHICVPQGTYQDSYQDSYQEAAPSEALVEEPEMVYCDVCGGWYEAGSIFRNHICTPME